MRCTCCWAAPPGLTSAGSQYIGLTDLGIGLTDQYTLIYSLSLGDVNADGREDLALNADGRDTVLLHGHADGFHPGPLVAPGQPGKDTIWRDSYGAALSGDLTGDGYVDLAINHEPMIIQIGTSKGLGSTVAQWSIPGRPAARQRPSPERRVATVVDPQRGRLRDSGGIRGRSTGDGHRRARAGDRVESGQPGDQGFDRARGQLRLGRRVAPPARGGAVGGLTQLGSGPCRGPAARVSQSRGPRSGASPHGNARAGTPGAPTVLASAPERIAPRQQ